MHTTFFQCAETSSSFQLQKEILLPGKQVDLIITNTVFWQYCTNINDSLQPLFSVKVPAFGLLSENPVPWLLINP